MDAWKNTLYYGDNLNILRDYLANESVDLIYLDPPFNSNRSYNVLFKDESGQDSEAQLTAFDDTWHWDTSAEATPRVGDHRRAANCHDDRRIPRVYRHEPDAGVLSDDDSAID